MNVFASRALQVTSVLLLASLATTPGSDGQQTAPNETIPSITIEWREHPDGSPSGRAAAYQGEVDEQGIDYVMPGNTVFGRSGLCVTGQPEQPLIIQVRNQLSDQWDRELKTDASGMANLIFRTEGEALVRIRSAADTALYQIMFFAGPELPIHRLKPHATVPMNDYLQAKGPSPASPVSESPAKSPSADRLTLLWVIVGLLAAIVVLLGMLIFRKNQKAKS